MGRQIAAEVQVVSDSPKEHSDEYTRVGDLVPLEAYRRSPVEQASGDDLTV